MAMKVFLGGTVNNSKWRETLMPKLKIDYFNPVVEEWNDEAYQLELKERETAEFCLYVITPKMEGFYSLAEIVEDSYKKADRTIYCYLPKDEGRSFADEQIEQLERIGQLVQANGAVWKHSLDEIADFLNSANELENDRLLQDSNQINNVFISYGRRHSLAFARKLYDSLTKRGYTAWFDMNDIPLGVDFQEQIDDGIRKADSFIYIMSPHSINSVYCYKELVLALKYNKRIIPVLHVEPQDSATWDKIDMEAGRRNWIYMRQEHDTALQLSGKAFELREKILNTPEKEWNFTDDYLTAFESLVSLLDNHRAYVRTHTVLLDRALEWSKSQHSVQKLLVGNERIEAERFLHRSHEVFRSASGHLINPPCTPTDLIAEFIMESRKNGHNMQCDFFVCHDTNDWETVAKIRNGLSKHGFSSWVSRQDIRKGDEYNKAIQNGVVQSSVVLFFISKGALKSDYCIKEYNLAKKYNKRIIPVLIDSGIQDFNKVIDSKQFPGLAQLQYIGFTDLTDKIQVEVRDHSDVKADVEARREKTPYDIALDEVVSTLNDGKSYYEEHRVFLVQALRWKEQGQKLSFLLRGHNLENARTWLRLNETRELYSPLELHRNFIIASEAAKGQLGTEVFISYSRKDGDFARHLNEKLQIAGKTTWFDQESISKGVDFEKEIFKGIDACDNFVFIISPDSVQSEYCEKEVNYAVSQNKRIITLLVRETDTALMPEALAKTNWIDFTSTDYSEAFADLLQEVEIDREYTHKHTQLQQRAIEWHEQKESPDYLLNASACTNAEEWLTEAGVNCPQISFKLAKKELDKQNTEKAKKRSLFDKFFTELSNTVNSIAGRQVLALYGFILIWLIIFFINNILYQRPPVNEEFYFFSWIIFIPAMPVYTFIRQLRLNKSKHFLKADDIPSAILKTIIGFIPLGLIWIFGDEIDTYLNFRGSKIDAIQVAGSFLYFYLVIGSWLFIVFSRLFSKNKSGTDSSKSGNKIIGFIKQLVLNVYFQTIFLLFLIKFLIVSEEIRWSITNVSYFLTYYFFIILVPWVFVYHNRPVKVYSKTVKKLIPIVFFIIYTIVVVLLTDTWGFFLNYKTLILIIEYWGVLLLVRILLAIKHSLHKKLGLSEQGATDVSELIREYIKKDTTKRPEPSGLQINYIHQSRVGIAVSKIQLQIIQRRLIKRLRAASVSFVLLGIAIVIIFSLTRSLVVIQEHFSDCTRSLVVNKYRNPEKYNNDDYIGYETEQAMYKLTQKLDLSHYELERTPSDIHEYKNLRVLYLRNNKLIRIPYSLYSMSGIEELYLSENRIMDVSIELFFLKNLKVVELRGNPLFKAEPKLATILLQKSDLPEEEIELLLNPQQRISLDWKNYQFEKIDTTIIDLENLQLIDMYNNFEIDALQLKNTFSYYKRPVVYICQDNTIEKHPDTLKINVSKFALLKIDRKRAKELIENTKLLSLVDKKISFLPSGIEELKNLNTLGLGYNSLKNLPEELLELKHLKELHVNNNLISLIPQVIFNLTSLEKLVLSDNYVEEIPAEIGRLTNLKELILDNNNIREIPDEIVQLTKLEKLSLKENEYLNKEIIEKLRKKMPWCKIEF